MAEVVLKDIVKNMDEKIDINIHSRGLSAINGSKASKHAIEIMKEDGIDLSKHRAKSITRKDVENADLILTMTYNHKIILLNLYEDARDKTYTLKEFAHGKDDLDIKDPFGRSVEIYRKNADEIREALEKVIKKIKNK
ncbi:low molecular weight protein arginine phosphatase [Clostridium sp. D2Q-14]|nr:low molecular weight protein arginine phosphatase [Anaeromonas gelatinilytica]